MTDKIEDGGPAFPFAATDPSNVQMQCNGMTLRDWFAGQALASAIKIGLDDVGRRDRLSMYAAEASYKVADAMIAARKGGAS